MNIKEQESQLSLNLNLRITVRVLAYLVLVGFIAYRLFASRMVPKIIETTSNTSVPSLKLDNYETLQLSVKVLSPVSGQVARPEPFD